MKSIEKEEWNNYLPRARLNQIGRVFPRAASNRIPKTEDSSCLTRAGVFLLKKIEDLSMFISCPESFPGGCYEWSVHSSYLPCRKEVCHLQRIDGTSKDSLLQFEYPQASLPSLLLKVNRKELLFKKTKNRVILDPPV